MKLTKFSVTLPLFLIACLFLASCAKKSVGKSGAPASGEITQFMSDEIAPISLKPRTPGLSYDDSEIVARSNVRSKSTSSTAWEGTGFNPEGPAGLEGQTPPAFRDMSNLYGKVKAAEDFNTNDFDHIVDNPFLRAKDNPLSTFSIDVDTAGYSIVRQFLDNGSLPPKSSVRIEELVNYFDYDYAPPKDGKPFAVNAEAAECPWNADRLLARIAIKGREFPAGERPRANLVFLLDVSGSMDAPNRLPLVKAAMEKLVGELRGIDRVAICVYAGAAGTVLEPTGCDNKKAIIAAIHTLEPSGSTAGSAGIQLAYSLAQKNFDPGAINRVILCTDGDFNVGASSRSELIGLIEEKAKSGVYLTVLGFGMNNYKDGMLKSLSTKGSGNYGYIDTIEEAEKMLVKQLNGTLVAIANDVKIQVEFNPATVGAYRLIGYENRILRAEDFNDDAVDAGDIGAGHTVTAFYEIIPPGSGTDRLPQTDPLKYSAPTGIEPPPAFSDELLTVKLRYKLPKQTESALISFPVKTASVRPFGGASGDFVFAASVAAFGMLLRDSPYKGSLTFDMVQTMARRSIGNDAFGYRAGFLKLAEKAGKLMQSKGR